MFGFLSSGGKRLIGIDFGASALKIVSGRLQGSKFAVDALSVLGLSGHAIDDRGIQDANKVLNTLLQALESSPKFSSKSAYATAVHGSGVYTKRITLPKIPKKEIPEQVRWEAEQVFPQDLSSIVVDHVLLGEVSQVPNAPKGTKGWELLLVGVHNEDVMGIREITDEAGIDLRLIDLDSFAAGDFLESVLKLNKKKPTALVDIGATATRVSVRHQGQTVFMREFPVGGFSFTDAISSQLGLSMEDAEILKVQGVEGAFPQEAIDALSGVIQSWKDEIQQTEDIYVSQESDSTIKEWHIFGGGSLTPGLLEAIDDESFGKNIKLAGAEKFFKSAHKQVDKNTLQMWAARLVTAAGLASRSA
ncbi:type IV pilus assembly protein PilM [bacterium]|nr:type IV pilus assembly protein PilM [bacterium]